MLDERRQLDSYFNERTVLGGEEEKNKLISIYQSISELPSECNLMHRLADMYLYLNNKIKQKKQKNMPDFKNENELIEWFISYFEEYFHIETEVNGLHTPSNKKVRIDILLYPKNILIDNGFEKVYIGVEIKYFPYSSKLYSKGSQAFWQTMTYSDSEFYTKNKTIKPDFCLLFSNYSFQEAKESLEIDLDRNFVQTLRAYTHLASHGGVGTVHIGRVLDSKNWAFRFANHDYFRKNHNGYKLANRYLKLAKNAGNIQ